MILQLLLVSLPVLAGNPAAQLAFSTQPVGSTLGAGLGSVIVQLADKMSCRAERSLMFP